MRRLLLVYNPHSTNYQRVKREILDHLELFEGYEIIHHTIKKAPFKINQSTLEEVLKDGDLLLSLGGDATAAVSANAILHSGRDVALAVLPYGNFNDLARTLGTMNFKDLKVAGISLSGGLRSAAARVLAPAARGDGPAGRDPRQTNPATLYPLEIYVDGKFWRYATCYVTIGMTAEAVELFDEPKFRKYMQKGHKSSWRSYLALVKWYFKNRHKKVFLPEFTINKRPTVKKASDYAAVNGRSMCRVMKGGNDFRRPYIFRSKALKTISFPHLFILMVRSILYRTPGIDTKGDILEFKSPATVELQAEGEYQIFKDVKQIEVKKGKKCLKVVTKH